MRGDTVWHPVGNGKVLILVIGGEQCSILDWLLVVQKGWQGVQEYRVLYRVAVGAISLSVGTGSSTQHFLLVAACLVHHLTSLLTTIQVHSLLVRTGPISNRFVPLTASLVHHVTTHLPLVSLYFPVSYLLSDWHFLLAVGLCPLLYSIPLLCLSPSAIHFSLKMEAARSKVLKHVGLYCNTTQCHNPDLNLNLHHCENLKSFS